MILIADSGSSKTDWRLWNPKNGEVFSFVSQGLNPYFISSFEIASVINKTIPNLYTEKINQIYFYGSGCGSYDSKKIVSEGLQQASSRAKIEVNHDLMGASRALFGREPGIACILGTGSNACYYNGKEIEEEAVSFGFIMGDEGSGNHLGRLLLKSIFSKKAPQDLQVDFRKQFADLDLASLLRRLYHSPFPNKFLAGFSPFILKHRNNEFIKEIIYDSFNQFITEFIDGIVKSKNDQIGFQGSIAHYYQKEIIEVFSYRKLNPTVFLKKNIEQLLAYHQKSI